ncbi:component of SufBCD complex [Salinihabitans flavidus]|uniref:component of SufBCD complex n=1 Tax=Salinihabitans flavidus TaxID=569882 RepID=UPI000B87D40E|nr:component of SufBCD complex [Salinihabitans flavidus]
MHWYQTVFELIDMRSFTNLWYWVALAVMWSSASHWVLGVPYDMILRARRQGGAAQRDLEDMVRINTNRLLHFGRSSGVMMVSFGCFMFTIIVVLGFWYRLEFAQAVFLLLFPLSLVGIMGINTARLIQSGQERGETLHKRLAKHRLWTQVIGMLAILVTSIWGMYQNLQGSPLH